MAQVRRSIKDHFGQDHLSLQFIDLSREEYIQLNNQRQESVGSRNEAVQFLDDPEAIVSTAVRLLESPEWAEVAAGLSLLTGRRCSELLGTAQFSLKSKMNTILSRGVRSLPVAITRILKSRIRWWLVTTANVRVLS